MASGKEEENVPEMESDDDMPDLESVGSSEVGEGRERVCALFCVASNGTRTPCTFLRIAFAPCVALPSCVSSTAVFG